MHSYPVVYPALPLLETGGACTSGVSLFLQLVWLGTMAPLNILSGISRAEPSVIILSGAHRLRAQVVALPGAGVPIALMIAPLVAVGVEAEVLVVRQSPGATAVAVALLRLPLWVAGPPPCRGFLTTLPRLPVCVACLPCCRGFFFLGAWEYFKKAKKYGRKAGMGTGTWRWQNELPSPPLLQPRPLSLLLPFAFSPLHPPLPANLFV